MMTRRSGCRHRDAGYTLIELLVAASLVILLSGLTCAVLAEVRTTMAVAADRAEVQQRARVGLDTVGSAIRTAGVGPDRGGIIGPLVRWAPPIRPGRPGSGASDFSTAVTTLEVSGFVLHAMLARDAPAGTDTLEFDRVGACPLPCGFADRMTVLLLDGRGDFDLFVLTETDGASATVRRLEGGTGASYLRGTPVLPAELRTYYLNARTHELRAHDGDRSDLPVVNDVVELTFDYLGDPLPPREPRPPVGEENCLYDSSGVARPGLQTLSREGGTLARLSAAILQDGPWCGAGSEPFDVDLLRIRAVRLTLRLQAGNATLRGRDAGWFRNPGTAADAARVVKDISVHTTITPPNLGGLR